LRLKGCIENCPFKFFALSWQGMFSRISTKRAVGLKPTSIGNAFSGPSYAAAMGFNSHCRWLNLHEHQSKELMSAFNVRVQKGKVAHTAVEAEACAHALRGKFFYLLDFAEI
jgi:hypothetical protein